MKSNILARLFDWIGDALERFNPSAFRFLAAVLPYLTPVPVAWLTASSSSVFLHFTPTVSFIFVFALEGIGLWFTTLLVDAVVEFVRSHNWKSLLPVLLFGLTVYAYVSILISLNVTLESANGIINPAMSKVITLLCFLPLITGVGNGYYKLKLESKTDMEISRSRQHELELRKQAEDAEFRKSQQAQELEIQRMNAELEFRKEQERNALKLQKFRIRNETSKTTSESSKTVPEMTFRTSTTSKTTSRTGRPSIHQERVFSYLEQIFAETGEVPTFTEVMQAMKLPQSTASRLRNEWLETKQ